MHFPLLKSPATHLSIRLSLCVSVHLPAAAIEGPGRQQLPGLRRGDGGEAFIRVPGGNRVCIRDGVAWGREFDTRGGCVTLRLRLCPWAGESRKTGCLSLDAVRLIQGSQELSHLPCTVTDASSALATLTLHVGACVGHVVPHPVSAPTCPRRRCESRWAGLLGRPRPSGHVPRREPGPPFPSRTRQAWL